MSETHAPPPKPRTLPVRFSWFAPNVPADGAEIARVTRSDGVTLVLYLRNISAAKGGGSPWLSLKMLAYGQRGRRRKSNWWLAYCPAAARFSANSDVGWLLKRYPPSVDEAQGHADGSDPLRWVAQQCDRYWAEHVLDWIM